VRHSTLPIERITTDDLADEIGPIPTFPARQMDERGRLISLSPEERQARSRAAIRALEAIEELPNDDPREIEAAFMRGIDENRPADRKIFEGQGLY
jgi:hypothetical protein